MMVAACCTFVRARAGLSYLGPAIQAKLHLRGGASGENDEEMVFAEKQVPSSFTNVHSGAGSEGALRHASRKAKKRAVTSLEDCPEHCLQVCDGDHLRESQGAAEPTPSDERDKLVVQQWTEEFPLGHGLREYRRQLGQDAPNVSQVPAAAGGGPGDKESLGSQGGFGDAAVDAALPCEDQGSDFDGQELDLGWLGRQPAVPNEPRGRRNVRAWRESFLDDDGPSWDSTFVSRDATSGGHGLDDAEICTNGGEEWGWQDVESGWEQDRALTRQEEGEAREYAKGRDLAEACATGVCASARVRGDVCNVAADVCMRARTQKDPHAHPLTRARSRLHARTHARTHAHTHTHTHR